MSNESRVLVVDDNEDLTRIISFILTAEGYTIYTCNTLSEAYTLVQSFAPHVILLDVNVGNEDGRELCFKIKHDGTLSSKVILMSGDETLIHTFMADDHISKPFDTAQLLEKVNHLIKSTVNS